MSKNSSPSDKGPESPSSGDADQTNKVAAVYARTSSPSQEFGYSISEQVRQCWEHCQNMGWDVGFVFKDISESGRNMERSQFQKLLSRVEEGRIDVVVFWRLDRFARSLADLVRIEDKLSSLGVQLKSVCEPIDTTSAVGRFSYRNLASAAELESDLTGQRTKLGLFGLAQEGKWPNSKPPIGYELADDKRLEVVTDEAALVYRIFQLYLEARSMPEVAHRLNEKGIRTKNGEEWTRQSVKAVLSNEIYIGNYEVAGHGKQIEEYRILPDELFNDVTETRYRYKSSKPKMAQSRKESKAQSILESFRTSVSGME